jgi:hypothetical protein
MLNMSEEGLMPAKDLFKNPFSAWLATLTLFSQGWTLAIAQRHLRLSKAALVGWHVLGLHQRDQVLALLIEKEFPDVLFGGDVDHDTQLRHVLYRSTFAQESNLLSRAALRSSITSFDFLWIRFGGKAGSFSFSEDFLSS